MSEKNYDQIAEVIVETAGGLNNITECYHCMSRLRLNLKNADNIDLNKIKEAGFKNVVINGKQLQVIAGNEIYDIYDAVIKIVGTDRGLGELTSEEEAKKEKKKFSIKDAFFSFFGGISASVQPCIPVLIGAGILQGLYLLAAQIGILSEDSYTYQILVSVCNSAFYFFPVYVGFNCAKQYGGNQLLGAFIGAMLIHPDFTSLVSSGESLTFLGITVRAVDYSSTVLPAFISVWVMCKVEKFFAAKSPKNLRVVAEPFCTVLIMVPLTLWIFAPLGDYCSIAINAVVTLIHDYTGPFAPAIIAAIVPFLVLTGTHSIIGTLAVQSIVTLGKESIMMPGALIHNFNHAALSLGVAVKTKDKDNRGTALSCSFTAFVGGISEPSLFGYFARYKSCMIALLVGQFVSGLWCGITSTGIYAFPAGGPAFTQILAFLGGETSNFVNAIIATALGMIVTFVLTVILYRDDEEERA